MITEFVPQIRTEARKEKEDNRNQIGLVNKRLSTNYIFSLKHKGGRYLINKLSL